MLTAKSGCYYQKKKNVVKTAGVSIRDVCRLKVLEPRRFGTAGVDKEDPPVGLQAVDRGSSVSQTHLTMLCFLPQSSIDLSRNPVRETLAWLISSDPLSYGVL